MIEKLALKAGAWTEAWGQVVFKPADFFASLRTKPAMLSSPEFFVGTIVLSYVLTFLTAVAFFLVYHGDTLARKLPPRINEDLALLTKLFFVYCIVTFLAFLVSSAISYVAAVASKTSASFRAHFDGFMFLSALEPLCVFFLALYFLYNRSPVPTWSVLAVFLMARTWGCVAGWHMITRVHAPIQRPRLAYFIGFLPTWVILNTFLAALLWIILSWAIVPYWD